MLGCLAGGKVFGVFGLTFGRHFAFLGRVAVLLVSCGRAAAALGPLLTDDVVPGDLRESGC